MNVLQLKFVVFCVLFVKMSSSYSQRNEVIDADKDGHVRYCQPQTPCQWKLYSTNSRTVDMHVINKFCTCPPGATCESCIDYAEWRYSECRCQTNLKSYNQFGG